MPRRKKKPGEPCAYSGEHKRCFWCEHKTCPTSDCSRTFPQFIIVAMQAPGYWSDHARVAYFCSTECEVRWRLVPKDRPGHWAKLSMLSK